MKPGGSLISPFTSFLITSVQESSHLRVCGTAWLASWINTASNVYSRLSILDLETRFRAAWLNPRVDALAGCTVSWGQPK
jgi:hypothetical protein